MRMVKFLLRTMKNPYETRQDINLLMFPPSGTLILDQEALHELAYPSLLPE